MWPENWETVMLFWSIQHCWVHKPMGGVSGMDWTRIESKLRMRGMGRRRLQRAEPRLELMESAILKELARE